MRCSQRELPSPKQSLSSTYPHTALSTIVDKAAAAFNEKLLRRLSFPWLSYNGKISEIKLQSKRAFVCDYDLLKHGEKNNFRAAETRSRTAIAHQSNDPEANCVDSIRTYQKKDQVVVKG